MSELHASVYLTSRVASAVVNAAAVAVFTRLSSQALYGQYLIGFAISFVIFSFGVQWAAQAHFGSYVRSRAARLAGALLVISGIATIVALLVVVVLCFAGVLTTSTAWVATALIVSFTLFFAATEIGRTHLMVGTVTLATLIRSFASLLFGVFALLQFHTADALLVAVGLGYAAGSVPVLIHLRRTIWSNGLVWPHRADLAQMMRYGWPLIVAFGASAAAMNVDRILLERFADVSTVAPYGAVLDFMKQTFLVVAEAISVGYISYAKTLQIDGNKAGSDELLRRAFVTQCYLVVFGTVFFVLLGEPLFAVLLPPAYLPAALQILPILLVANALLVLRAYHFGQVIYLGASSKLEFAASVVMLVVAAAASFVLIPAYGAVGAATAFALSQAAALVVYLVATPKRMRLPLDWSAAGMLIAAGLALVLAGEAIRLTSGHTIGTAINLVLLALTATLFLVRWNLFGVQTVMQRIQERLAG